MKPTVYLAGPIDDISGLEARSWRQVASQLLNASGFTTYSPIGAFSLPSDHAGMAQGAGYVNCVNEIALRSAGFVLVYLDGPGRGIGTIRELELAVRMGKPTLVVINTDHFHLALWDVNCVPTVEMAVARIESSYQSTVRSTTVPYADTPDPAHHTGSGCPTCGCNVR